MRLSAAGRTKAWPGESSKGPGTTWNWSIGAWVTSALQSHLTVAFSNCLVKTLASSATPALQTPSGLP